MQPVHYHNKIQSVKHKKKKCTAQFKYVVKSVSLSKYKFHDVMQNILFYVDIGMPVNIINHILAFKYIANMKIFDFVEWETQLWFQFHFSLN